ncbi:MAG: phage tail tape measure protein [Prevotella sp.]|nr:phage tail tape measure protein [Prevotella sp.]
MASHEQTYTTKVLLNSEQAKKEITNLEKKVEGLKRKRQEALSAGDTKTWQKLNKEIDKHESKLISVKNRLEGVNKTLENMSTAGPKQLKNTIRDINKLLDSGTIERGSKQWNALTASLREANTELSKIKSESKATEPVLGRVVNFFNKNWGVITQALGAITGLTMTARKAVQDYAAMEEEMADVRKYTGLATEQVRDLNGELKKMDTRTSREELNQLAGAAGRLGISSKDGILEFVDAADKIKVALGDDLGEGAVDQIGKLAMAFGEDEKMGLRGAMLATGSAVNELAQNSSAQAGYLVDFTARVAGFGKQLGLTQAQIMGYGAVMDENMMRDEMAATAFGNMLTKMQTDTEKFARIAGMEVKEFTRLLNEDANQAILNLADSLRSQNPQTMMKMLDDMGLDGARAVGVLSTMADKIDDVRERQRLATAAYKEGNSVVREFGVMNTTVQARLEKCKKQFHEMTVELGEQLLPVVRYTCTSFSLFVKVLSEVTKFVSGHKGEIAGAAVALAAYTAYVKAATLATKIHTVVTKAAEVATKAFNLATKLNPIGLLIAALTAAVVLFIKYRDRINGASEAMSILKQAGAKLADVLAQVTGWMINLVKWAVSLYDKFSFLRKIVQLLVAGFTAGFTTITIAVKLLIDELDGVATVIEGIFTLDWNKIKDGYTKGFKAIANAAVSNFNNVKRTVKDVFSAPPPAGAGGNALAAGAAVGAAVGKAGTTREMTLPEVVVRPSKKTNYVSDSDTKKQEAARKKAEADRKKQEADARKELREKSRQLKAEMDDRLAEEAVSYSLGLTNYRDYVKKRLEIQIEGIKKRKDLFKEGSAEYLKLDAEEKMLLVRGDEESRKLTLKEKEREHKQKMAILEASFYDENSAVYHNDLALNEQRFQEEMDFLQWKKDQAIKGSLEEMQLEWELQDRSMEHQEQMQRDVEERLLKVRTEYLYMANDQQRDIELKALEKLYEDKLLQEDEYQRAKLAVEAKYASDPAQANRDKFTDSVNNGLSIARERAGDANAGNPWTGDLANYMNTNEQLKQLYEQDKLTHAEYLAAKAQNLSEFIEQVQQKYQVMFDSVSSVLGGISNYAAACSDYEVAVVTKNYDRQIEAAGNNENKRKKLEEKKQKEIAAIKTKANQRAMKIEIAQALASTAMGAINAYTSAAQVPYVGYILAPIAAAAAVAAGMLQVATIKKQHQTEEVGYYEGGFTGGRRYRQKAGVVHEGEFVANHQAVQNPAILPFLNFLDQAQRNNTVGSLTAQDVSRSMGAVGSVPQTIVSAPTVNVQTDNSELRDSIDRLNARLDEGIPAYSIIDGEQGTYRKIKQYERLIGKRS